jgi:NAD(P)-dependent dehydrogenase (short-subunit alcohol dehydrogenase family)
LATRHLHALTTRTRRHREVAIPADQRVAVVTGGGSGVGRATALALGRAGFSVAVAGRRPERLAEVVELGRAAGIRIIGVPTDVRDPESVVALFERVADAFGRVDLLFNNAGVGLGGSSFVDLSFDDWQATIDTNVTGAFLCAQRAVVQMLAQTPRGGRIINNGSVSAQTPRPSSAPYTASKHAVTGLTRSIALDYRDFDIACGQIDIGNAATEMTAEEDISSGIIQASGAVMVEATFDVEHVANTVVYMATLPLDVNVLFITVMANRMPFVGRG